MYTIDELKQLRTTEREVDDRGGKDIWTLKSYDRLRCIFVHIPKTAGIAIAHALFGDGGGSHIPIGTDRQIFDDAFDEYFKFAFS